jgi:hypothetical protein
MLFKPRNEKLLARRRRLEDELIGYVLARKAPPERLVIEASRLRTEIERLGLAA